MPGFYPNKLYNSSFFLMFYDYTTSDAAHLSFPTSLERSKGKAQCATPLSPESPLLPICCVALTESHLLTFFSDQGSMTL